MGTLVIVISLAFLLYVGVFSIDTARDESHIVIGVPEIGGIPLDLYDAQQRRDIREREQRKVGRLALGLIGMVVVLGLLCALLAGVGL